ncbi:MAG: NrsF family protein [Gallionellaceae bacterium]|nr:NrsF family protein [Gallionellaceae bacterium]
MFSLLPAAWTFFSMRRFASTHYCWASSIALLSAFSVGALWLRLHELNDSIIHVIQWHYLPMLGIGLIGWWLGKRVLKW